MSKTSSKNGIGIYLHIPYCLKKCPYCAFNSYEEEKVPAGYASSLVTEMDYAAELFGLGRGSVDTVYFGGGTPSLLDADDIAKLMEEMKSIFDLRTGCEVSLEVNPSSAGEERLQSFRKAGINRLSIGIQSFDNGNLQFLGRLHNGAQAKKTFFDARSAGIDNISIDLIFAIPGQSKDETLSDLQRAVDLSPEHISLYLFTLEEGTPMHKWAGEGKFRATDDSEQEEMFMMASAYLQDNGYNRYETSNYARDGFEARHNLGYWNGKDYIGLGAGAHSYLSDMGWGMRWWNHGSPKSYAENVKKGKLPVDGLEILGRADAIRETIFTALRTRDGLKEDILKDRFGITLYDVLSEAAIKSLPVGLLATGDNRIFLTERGALVADEIVARIIT